MWMKNGIEFQNPLVWQGKTIYNPTDAQLIAAGYVWHDIPAPPIEPKKLATVFTKRQIRLACRALGYEERLETILASSPTYERDWNEAQDIDFANAQTETAIEQAIAAGLFTRAEIDALFAKLREDYPQGKFSE